MAELEDWEVVEGSMRYHYQDQGKAVCGYPGRPRPDGVRHDEVNCVSCLRWAATTAIPMWRETLRHVAREKLREMGVPLKPRWGSADVRGTEEIP